MSLVTRNEKGGAAYDAGAWNDLLLQTFPDTPRDDIYSSFIPLYEQDPERAFKFAMMFGNLRPGAGGKSSFSSVVSSSSP